MNKLKQLVLKTKLPGATQKLAQLQKLPVYSETEEVAKILKEMLSDLSTRLSVINEVDAQAKKLVDDAYAKMVDWEKKLVKLADGILTLAFSAALARLRARGWRPPLFESAECAMASALAAYPASSCIFLHIRTGVVHAQSLCLAHVGKIRLNSIC